MSKLELWLRGVLAAAVSGTAGGILTGLAAVGVDPAHFNLQAGMGATMRMALAGAIINGVIGVAGYLQKSPLPDPEQRVVVRTTTSPSDATQTTTTEVNTGSEKN